VNTLFGFPVVETVEMAPVGTIVFGDLSSYIQPMHLAVRFPESYEPKVGDVLKYTSGDEVYDLVITAVSPDGRSVKCKMVEPPIDTSAKSA